MRLLRIILLVLAAVVFAAIGWRLVEAPGPRQIASTDSPPRTVAELAPPAPAVPPPVQAPSAPVPAPNAPAQPSAAPVAPQPAASAPPSSSAATSTPDAARQAILDRLKAAPDLARIIDAIKAAFPAVAERSLAAEAEAAQRSGQIPSADDVVAAAMRELRMTAGVLAARAGPEPLAAIFDAKAATLADLEAADPRICADFLFGSTSPEFSDFVAAHRALVARSSLALIAAMVDGRDRQTAWQPPTPEDYQLIETGLQQRGLSAAEIAALLDGKSLDPAPSDTRLCDNMRTYLDILRGLPPDARNRVYGLAAELLARS